MKAIAESVPTKDLEDLPNSDQPIEYESELHRALAEDSVGAIQSQSCLQVRSSAPIRQAIQALHQSRVSVLLVVDDRRVVGTFTERDVLEKVAEQYSRLAGAPVSQVMTADPAVIWECDPAATALAAIAVTGHRHVPVLSEDGRVQGVVAPQRVFNFVEKQFDS